MRWTKHGCFFSLADNSLAHADQANNGMANNSQTNSENQRVSHTQLPVVDTSAANYWRIYYSSRNADGRSLPYYIDVEPGNPKNIIKQSTQALLDLGETGRFDEHGVMPTAIVNHDGKKYLYYIGWSVKQSVPYQNAIGLAISDNTDENNDTHFKRYSEGPLIAQNHIDPIFTGTFNVLKVGSVWHGYYMSCTEWRAFDEGLEPRYLLKYASSVDGINWQRDNHIAIDYTSNEEGGIVAATTIAHDDNYRHVVLLS